MYYIRNDHEAIVDRETYERVQEERMRRSEARSHGQQKDSCFSQRIVCGNCDHFYRRKVTRKAELECEGTAGLTALRALIQKNARRAIDQEAYQREYDALSEQINVIRERIAGVDRAILNKRQRHVQTEQIMSRLKAGEWIGDFDEGLFGALVDRVTVCQTNWCFGSRMIQRE